MTALSTWAGPDGPAFPRPIARGMGCSALRRRSSRTGTSRRWRSRSRRSGTLSGPEGTPHRWGFQIVREIKGKNQENDVWAPMSRGVAGFMTQMGVLEGMTDLSTSRNIEVLPTFTAVRFGSLDETTGEFLSDTTPEGGVNFKYGITSNLTADFTLNPDFSQIESDRPQITVNQRFPLFFSELRPFFLEGQEIFNFTSPVNLVHTRTIVDPRYGGKLTGKVGRTTLGVIFADDEAPGKRDDLADPAFGQTARTLHRSGALRPLL